MAPEIGDDAASLDVSRPYSSKNRKKLIECKFQLDSAIVRMREQDLQLDALKAQVAELERDAARYRLVRRGQHWSVINGIGDELQGDVLDAVVDARLAASKEAP